MSTSHDAESAMRRHDPEVVPVDQSPTIPAASLHEEIAAMNHREKWAEFYDALGRFMHEQFDRSNELLRQAMVLPAAADQDVASIQRQAAERVAAERRRHSELLKPIYDEMIEATGELAQMQQRLTELAARLEQMAQDVASAVDGINQGTSPPATPPPPPDNSAPMTEVDEPAVVSSEPVSQLLVVHGVRQARLALSLQRHLYSLAPVKGVDTREYQDGTLQLCVRSSRALTQNDLQSWADGSSLQIERMTVERIEARLPEADDSAGGSRPRHWWGS